MRLKVGETKEGERKSRIVYEDHKKILIQTKLILANFEKTPKNLIAKVFRATKGDDPELKVLQEE